MKFQLSYAGAPLDYPTLGFTADADGAILDGTLFDPDLTIPPDARWSVYGGGSAETNITRYATPSPEYLNPVPETTDGWLLAYDTAENRATFQDPADLIETGAWATPLSAAIVRRALTSFGAVDTTGAVAADTTMAAALTWAQSVGGTIVLPVGTVRLNNKITLTNDGDVFSPRQRNVRLTGMGHAWNGMFLDPLLDQGSVLDLRYAGTDADDAKIETRGTGVLELDHLTVTDKGTSSNVWIYTTQTTLMIHDCVFFGNSTKIRRTCDQDVIRMGGTTASYNGTDDSGYAGYGAVIERNQFFRIRRAVHARLWVNSITFRNNTIANSCGSDDLTHGAPFELDSTHTTVPGSPGFSNGCVFAENTVEVTGYMHGFALYGPYTVANWFIANGCWDAEDGGEDPGTYGGDYYFGPDATNNTVLAGPGHSTRIVEDAAVAGTNRLWDFGGIMHGLWQFQAGNTTTPSVILRRVASQSAHMLDLFDEDGVEYGAYIDQLGGINVNVDQNGGVGDAYPVKVVHDSWGTPAGHFQNKKGFGVLLGSPVLQAAIEFTNGSGTTITGEFAGAGSPEGVKTAPVGSTYRRTDGGAGTTFYVKESGTGNTGWVAK